MAGEQGAQVNIYHLSSMNQENGKGKKKTYGNGPLTSTLT